MKKTTTIYIGHAADRTVTVRSDKTGDRLLSPEKSLRVRYHSPDGFEWGYGGSGPAQLALAVLLDYYEDRSVASARYMTFKAEVIGQLPQGEDWLITGLEIEAFSARFFPRGLSRV